MTTLEQLKKELEEARGRLEVEKERQLKLNAVLNEARNRHYPVSFPFVPKLEEKGNDGTRPGHFYHGPEDEGGSIIWDDCGEAKRRWESFQESAQLQAEISDLVADISGQSAIVELRSQLVEEIRRRKEAELNAAELRLRLDRVT